MFAKPYDSSPFVELLAELKPLTPRRSGPAGWMPRVIEAGGLWRLCAGSDPIWPQPPSRLSRKAVHRHHGQLRELLVRCEAEVTRLAMDFVSRNVTPFPEYILTSLARTSEKALLWSLHIAAFESQELRPESKLDFAAEKLQLTASDPHGDAIVLHAHIERLVSQKLTGDSKNDLKQLPGGLRTSSFLRAYPQLAPNAALNRLITASALTKLVYGDILGLPANKPRFLGSMQKVSVDAAEFWLSQIARSVVAAWLSKSPDAPKHSEYGFHAAQAGQESSRQSLRQRQRRKYESTAAKARKAAAEIEQRIADQRVGRIIAAGEVLQNVSYLKMRVMDMLVRHVVAAGFEEIAGQYDPTSGLPLTDVGRPDQKCFLTFREVFFGSVTRFDIIPGRTLIGDIQERQEYWKASNLLNYLAGKQENSAELLAKGMTDVLGLPTVPRQADLPVELSNMLARRYEDPVALPFPAPHDAGPSPGALVDQWLSPLCSDLPSIPPRRLPLAATGKEISK